MSIHSTSTKVRFKSLKFLDLPDYCVGINGSVWSKKWGTWKKLKPQAVNKRGHLGLNLSKRGTKAKCWLLHRLVLLAFVGPCPPGMEGCHFPDRDPANCHIDNLRWGTRSHNMRDKVFHGTDNRGEKHASAKCTKKKVAKLRKWYATGNYTMQSLADHCKMAISSMYRILRHKTYF